MGSHIGSLVDHLRTHSLRTGGPFHLASGSTSDWYLDGRQTTFDGTGGRLVAAAVRSVLLSEVTAVGGMTMGADPIAIATAVLGEPALRAFSVRKAAKDYGMGERIVGLVTTDDRIAVVEDTTTTGGSMAEAIGILTGAGMTVVQAVTMVDRSNGRAVKKIGDFGLTLTALIMPEDLGIR